MKVINVGQSGIHVASGYGMPIHDEQRQSHGDEGRAGESDGTTLSHQNGGRTKLNNVTIRTFEQNEQEKIQKVVR